jgi:hypothetical protein
LFGWLSWSNNLGFGNPFGLHLLRKALA